MRYFILIGYLFILGITNVNAQTKTIVLFDRKSGDTLIENEGIGYFYLKPQIDASHFKTTNSAKGRIIYFCEVSNNLITKQELNKIVEQKLNEKALGFEKKTGKKGNFIRNTPYDYNSIFDTIYIYKPTNINYGEIYEVDWIYAIE